MKRNDNKKAPGSHKKAGLAFTQGDGKHPLCQLYGPLRGTFEV
jgi:hypothetical protein